MEIFGQAFGLTQQPKLFPSDLLLERSKDGLHGLVLHGFCWACAWMKVLQEQGEISLQPSATAANQHNVIL